ncbi:MAG: hypothetical protein P4L10_16340 [Acidobacteriaceae bacterium]|nr:hypothetical protein [Acidobacteriaceae bacterium]
MSIRTTLRSRQSAFRILALCVALASTALLSGCGAFFHAVTTTTTTNSGTGYDLVYAGKNGSSTFVGYTMSSTTGNLTAVSGSPYSIASVPLTMAITPANTYLYVGTAAGIYGYSIAAGGALTALNSGSALATGLANSPASLDISADGNFLAVLTNNYITSGTATIYIYQIASSTGLLTSNGGSATVTIGTSALVHTVKFSPNEDLIVTALGSAGTDVYSFNSSSGAISALPVSTAPAPTGTASDNAAIFSYDGATLYIVRGSGASLLLAYPIAATTGTITTTAGSTGSYTLGNSPSTITLNKSTASSPYLYVTNAGDGSISGFKISSTSSVVLTALPKSPYSTLGTTPYSIGYDNTGTYMLTMNQTGSPDLLEYTIDTTSATAGQLYVTASVNTGLSISSGTVGPGITMVTTH